MRRDICFFVQADPISVYNAYLDAATHEPFERDCHKEPYYKISFGVNYSFKYNMNGGACTLQFIPFRDGTAVNMHFTIAQAFGARYENYAEDLNKAMQKFLPVRPQEIDLDTDLFEKEENRITPISTVVTPAPITAAAPAVATVYCANCGAPIAADNKFCSKCGTAVAPVQQKVCPNCNADVKDGDAFCGKCGTRL